MGYAELLKDPRWQKRRLEVMERDEWTCQSCKDTKATLTVHHKSYRMDEGKFAKPWDYEDDHLITLCDMCHSKEESNLKAHKVQMYFAMRNACENSEVLRLAVRLFIGINEIQNRRVTVEDIVTIQENCKSLFGDKVLNNEP